jgi:hypothetical protein
MESPESQALGVSTIGSSEAIILSVRPIHLARISDKALMLFNATGACREKALEKHAQGSRKALRQA